MNQNPFRLLSLACCIAAVIFTLVGLMGYKARKESVDEWNSRAAGGANSSLEFQAPAETSRSLLIAGLLMALSGCLHLKAHEAAGSRVSVEDEF